MIEPVDILTAFAAISTLATDGMVMRFRFRSLLSILVLCFAASAVAGATRARVDESRAQDAVMNLPEVSTQAKLVQTNTGGRSRLVILTDANPGGASDAWEFCVAESHEDHVVPWQRFRVNAVSGAVTVWTDAREDAWNSLDAWREQRKAEARRLAGFEERLRIRQEANSFQDLVAKTKPRFIWNDQDMLWITHDAEGRVGFVVNRAYKLKDPGESSERFYLFDVKEGFEDADCEVVVDYTRHSCERPKVLARDAERGVVYDCAWPSPVYSGTGAAKTVRHVLMLCDAAHRWTLLGEGPEEGSHKTGMAWHYSTSVETTVRWTDESRDTRPVRLGFTTITLCETPGSDESDSRFPSLEVRCDGTLSGPYPARTVMSKIRYIVPKHDEPFAELVRRVTHWHSHVSDDDEDEVREAARRKASQTSIAEALRKLNPDISDVVKAGTRVSLGDPEALWKTTGAATASFRTSRQTGRDRQSK